MPSWASSWPSGWSWSCRHRATSIGMYVVRRLTGRPTDVASEAPPTSGAETLEPPETEAMAETAAVVRSAGARTTYLSATYYGPDGTRVERTTAAGAAATAAAP